MLTGSRKIQFSVSYFESWGNLTASLETWSLSSVEGCKQNFFMHASSRVTVCKGSNDLSLWIALFNVIFLSKVLQIWFKTCSWKSKEGFFKNEGARPARTGPRTAGSGPKTAGSGWPRSWPCYYFPLPHHQDWADHNRFCLVCLAFCSSWLPKAILECFFPWRQRPAKSWLSHTPSPPAFHGPALWICPMEQASFLEVLDWPNVIALLHMF